LLGNTPIEPRYQIAGNMNRVGAMQRVTTAAVDSAPAKGANLPPPPLASN
jgi:hypothetical protein